jgi:aspartate racemase
MKKIGIIGGIGPESTLDYYRRLIRAFQERKSTDYPEIIIYSANLNELLKLMEGKRWEALTEWLLHRIEALRKAGAEFGAIGSNSPHVVFEAVKSRSSLPLVSIVEATCRKAQELGVKRLGLMGTAFTMQADFFQKPFLAKGMSVVMPEPEDQKLIHRRLFTERRRSRRCCCKPRFMSACRQGSKRSGRRRRSSKTGKTDGPKIKPISALPFVSLRIAACSSSRPRCVKHVRLDSLLQSPYTF